MSHTNRQHLRKHFKAARAALSATAQHQAATALCQQLQSSKIIQHARTVSVYLAHRGEINLTPFITWCWQQKKMTALPVLHPFSQGYLLFQGYSPMTQMTKNRFHIEEPALACNTLVTLAELDVILMPLVAFDQHKNRLGMGGGFYDRTLAAIRDKNKKAIFIGVAHECQYYDNTLPAEPWDIPLDYVVTPEQII
ncbi:5-formyltetrahydrofolate cyclo-ligase [Alteromonas sediminis]|uniref:5-formyltetrahydrofolate cyclo-ligase n=1 Tax=Alteromonas sediminis TaxID=2259342 RepID=A0A3N5YPX7_9ALTE|nr:5-formyltetrahydrofolate cyclo-ligase [Alteromonas sediminis]RPJ67981.1 5-formyltetrahydrofolate cyclo-ligase [Alteromonas sediminis]